MSVVGPFPTYTPNDLYTPQAVTFDGSTTYLHRGGVLTGAAATTVGIFSVWIKMAVPSSDQFFFQTSVGDDAIYYLGASNSPQIDLYDCTPTHQMFGKWNSHNSTSWHHFIASWNISASVFQAYYDGVNDKLSVNFFSTGNACWTTADTYVGTGVAAPQRLFNGSMADFYLNTSQFIDLSVSANLALFIKNGRPVYPGANGQLPTGSSPTIFLTGNSSTFPNNVGTGGAYVVVGALGNDPNGPP